MKLTKKLTALGLAVAMVASIGATSVFASEDLGVMESQSDFVNIENSSSDEHQITPYINWDGSANLVTHLFSNITSSNNWFNDSPKVISNINNPGLVYLRVMSSNGSQIGDVKIVAPGKSVVLDEIPFNSGTYTIQGMGTVSGAYYFDID